MTSAPAIFEALRANAANDPGGVAYRFLQHDGLHCITHRELWRRVSGAASMINAISRPGDRILIAYPPSLEFVIGLLGCLCSRAIAVPAAHPGPAKHLERLASICRDASPVAALGAFSPGVAPTHGGAPFLAEIPWLHVADLQPCLDATAPNDADEPAMLQYTSGSTFFPKGVILTHANLAANTEAIARRFELSERDSAVFWLPPYHDMGLVGGILTSLRRVPR